MQEYSAVRAMQLSAKGQRLTVLGILSNGESLDSSSEARKTVLDVWDIHAGTLMGRWHLQGEYTAMCHRNEHFLFAHRDTRRGPVLEVATLPEVRGTVGCDKARSPPFIVV